MNDKPFGSVHFSVGSVAMRRRFEVEMISGDGVVTTVLTSGLSIDEVSGRVRSRSIANVPGMVSFEVREAT